MANIFKQSLDVTQHPNRNNHDLSHKVHGSYKMGVLYPFLCHPVVPNDSFRIDTACAFQLMPMPFPTQTNIRCIFHYFYVRNKNIWENWENWLQGLEEHTPPYINQPASFYKTGSLADHLGIPTTVVTSRNIEGSFTQKRFLVSGDTGDYNHLISNSVTSLNYRGPLTQEFVGYYDGDTQYSQNSVLITRSQLYFDCNNMESFGINFKIPVTVLGLDNTDVLSSIKTALGNYFRLSILSVRNDSDYISNFDVIDQISLSSLSSLGVVWNAVRYTETINEETYAYAILSLDAGIGTGDYADFKELINSLTSSNICLAFSIVLQSNPDDDPIPISVHSGEYYLTSPSDIYEVSSVSGINPFYSSNNSGTDTVKISALPFRAYESIIRCYYKNSVLQPLKIDGVEKYNRYNTALGDGADSTDYVLEQRNWELDAYTSCLPSPQQGNTPLIGISDSGRGVIEDPETGERLRFNAIRDSENGTESIEVEGGEGLENMRALVNLSRSNSSGITIPDIRNVNALQRFLEQSIRSGYKYIDFIKGHFGSEPKYAELDMPEFLGGFTQRVDVNMISNSNGVVPTEAEDIALGSFAGQARAFGGAKHGITRYFDDYGWIVGIMCIVPDNTYSQLLPKWFTYTDRLSYFFPEFAQTNLQPITYSEVCPIQSHLEYSSGQTGHLLTDTFGYQRPNHELVWVPDSLHGEFRKTLNNYVINRVFASRPELGDQFLKIDPEDTNRIFSYTEADNDVVVGQIAIKMIAKRPVPRIVIPSLGK